MPRTLKNDQLWISLFGLGFVTYPRFFSDLSLGLDNLELFDASHAHAALEVRDDNAFSSCEILLDTFWRDFAHPDSSN